LDAYNSAAMDPSRSILHIIYGIASLSGAVGALIVWRRHSTASRPLALLLLSAAFWALCDAIEISVTGVNSKRLVSQVQYLSVVSVAPLFLHSALALSRLEKHLTRPVLWVVWGIPIASLAVAWTSQWHHWLWKEILIPDPVSNAGVYVYGWWFWVLAAQSYILLAFGTVIVLRTAGKVLPSFRASMFLVAAAVLLPWIGNIAYNFKLGPWPGVNWFSVSLTASGILLAWSTLHGGLFDLLPRAREALVECMSDAVVVLDQSGRVLLQNSSAREIFEGDKEGRILENVRSQIGDSRGGTWQGEMEIGCDRTARWLEVRATAIHDRWFEVAGRLLVIRDITAEKAIQKEKEDLIAELRTALQQVQTLEGLLPICAGCKKIRDDHGYWTHVESYLADHANLRFTHGLCPECAKKFFPEVAAHD
jgi:PAS domain-containing protein